MTSGGVADMRTGFDGSGWTVSTGKSMAQGGARTGGQDLSGIAQGPIGQARALTAGFGGLPLLMLVGLGVYFFAKGKL